MASPGGKQRAAPGKEVCGMADAPDARDARDVRKKARFLRTRDARKKARRRIAAAAPRVQGA